MPSAELNGLEIHYDVHGEGEPLLCVHGLVCDRRAWVMQIQPFSEQDRMVLFDNRDTGQPSQATGDYTTADMAQDVLALADHLELASLIPGSKLTIIPRQGHGVMWEAAEQFNTAVTEFLAATPAEAVRWAE